MSPSSSTSWNLQPPDVFLGIGFGTHGAQTAKALVGVERVRLNTFVARRRRRHRAATAIAQFLVGH
jgi:hypothetical protein